MPAIAPLTIRNFGRMHGGRPTARDASIADATEACGARNRRFVMVGGISCSSPRSKLATASVGRTHMLATVSVSSCCEV